MAIDEALRVSESIFDLSQLGLQHVAGLIKDWLAIGARPILQLIQQAILSLQAVAD
jgi:hypothetical protein